VINLKTAKTSFLRQTSAWRTVVLIVRNGWRQGRALWPDCGKGTRSSWTPRRHAAPVPRERGRPCVCCTAL